MNSKVNLKIDWCTHEAAKYACEHWHYSKCMPVGKIVKIGAWENGKFIGCVLFSRGATPMLLKPYNLTQYQGCELTRIALTSHHSPVSKILAIALKFLKRNSPGLRLIISFADPSEGHHGGIYQATNWILTGKSSDAKFALVNGKEVHPRTVSSMRKSGKNPTKWIIKPGKWRYLMPLDEEMRKQIQPLSKPYPKRAPKAEDSMRLSSTEE